MVMVSGSLSLQRRRCSREACDGFGNSWCLYNYRGITVDVQKCIIMCSMHTEYVPSYFGHHVKITRNLYLESMMGLLHWNDVMFFGDLFLKIIFLCSINVYRFLYSTCCFAIFFVSFPENRKYLRVICCLNDIDCCRILMIEL